MSIVITHQTLLNSSFKKGSLISYLDRDGDKVLGILIGVSDGYYIDAYWQEYNKECTDYIKKFVLRDDRILVADTTLETDWLQLKRFRNIPDIALIPKK